MKIVGVIAGIFVILIVCVFVVGPVVVEHYAFKKISAEEAASYGPWKNQKLVIPPEAMKVAPFAPATEAAAKAFREEWKQNKKRADDVVDKYLCPGSSSENIDFVAANRDLLELAPLLQSFETLVAQPDYEISAQIAGVFWGNNEINSSGVPMANYLGVQICAKLLRLKALSQVNAGQSAQALDTAATIILSSKCTAYDYLITQLIGIAACSLGVHAWEEAIDSCKDTQLLRRTLGRQNQLSKQQAYLTSDLPIVAVDRLGTIREINRRGLNVNVQGFTARQIMAETNAAEAEYYREIVLPKFQNDPHETAIINSAIKTSQIQSSTWGRHPSGIKSALAWGCSNLVTPVFYAISLPNFTEAKTRAEVARTKFDLLRLNTARQIWTLEHGAPPARMADLVPSLLAELPVDRFAKGKEKNDKSEKQTYGEGTAWHSIGPDGMDQKGTLVYDPTNGTISPGDVVLAR